MSFKNSLDLTTKTNFFMYSSLSDYFEKEEYRALILYFND